MTAEPKELTKDDKDKLWRELKLKWSALKRGSNSNETQKEAAKKRINEIQDELRLDRTDFSIPYEPGKRSDAKSKKDDVGPNYDSGADENTRKVLGAMMDFKRQINEKLDNITALLEHQKKMVFPTNDMEK